MKWRCTKAGSRRPIPPLPLNAAYAAMVTRLDRNIGRLIATLDRQGLTREHPDRLHVRSGSDVRARQPGDECRARQ